MMKKYWYILKSGLSAMMSGSQWTALDSDPHKIQVHSKFLRLRVATHFIRIKWLWVCIYSVDRKAQIWLQSSTIVTLKFLSISINLSAGSCWGLWCVSVDTVMNFGFHERREFLDQVSDCELISKCFWWWCWITGTALLCVLIHM
jgi:hypothetical protein